MVLVFLVILFTKILGLGYPRTLFPSGAGIQLIFHCLSVFVLPQVTPIGSNGALISTLISLPVSGFFGVIFFTINELSIVFHFFLKAAYSSSSLSSTISTLYHPCIQFETTDRR